MNCRFVCRFVLAMLGIDLCFGGVLSKLVLLVVGTGAVDGGVLGRFFFFSGSAFFSSCFGAGALFVSETTSLLGLTAVAVAAAAGTFPSLFFCFRGMSKLMNPGGGVGVLGGGVGVLGGAVIDNKDGGAAAVEGARAAIPLVKACVSYCGGSRPQALAT